MELCHARYNFKLLDYVHNWLMPALMPYANRKPDENLALLDDLRYGIFAISLALSLMVSLLIYLSNRIEPRRRRSNDA